MKKPSKKKPTTSDTAMATSSSNPTVTSQPPPNCYTADELQEIIEKAHLEGWQEGYTKGKDYGVKEGMKLGRRSLHKGQAQGVLLGKAEERKEWLAAGHGPGLCLSMVAHARECFHSTIILQDAMVQTETATWTSTTTQATPVTAQTASQTTSTTTVNAVMQMASDNEPPRPLSDAGTSTEPPCTCETTVQANNSPQ
jgi:hypothetical protein